MIATAIVAAVADGRAFRNGRQFAAWVGLVPRQFSSGDKQRLGGISKRGDPYLRMLLMLSGVSFRCEDRLSQPLDCGETTQARSRSSRRRIFLLMVLGNSLTNSISWRGPYRRPLSLSRALSTPVRVHANTGPRPSHQRIATVGRRRTCSRKQYFCPLTRSLLTNHCLGDTRLLC